MNHIDALLAGEGHDSFDIQISSDRTFPLADQISFVRFEAMHRQTIFLRVNRHRAQAQFRGRAKNPDRDLAAVCHQ
jgi:hypothetical protein